MLLMTGSERVARNWAARGRDRNTSLYAATGHRLQTWSVIAKNTGILALSTDTTAPSLLLAPMWLEPLVHVPEAGCACLAGHMYRTF